MHKVMQPTPDRDWVLTHEGYNVLTENAVESRFALGNGFLGMRASRPVSRGPTWVSWLGHIRWASWPRCYVAGRFDRPNTVPPVPALVPVADWSRVRRWVNYFAVGHPSECFSFIKDWVEKKVRRHMAQAQKRQGFGWKRWSRQWLYDTLKLFNGYRVRRGRPKVAPAGWVT